MFEYNEEARQQFTEKARELIAQGITPAQYAYEQFVKVRNSIPADSPAYREIRKIKLGFYALYGAEKMLDLLGVR